MMNRKDLNNQYLAQTLKNVFNNKKSRSIKYFTQKAEQKRIAINKRRKMNKMASKSRKKNR